MEFLFAATIGSLTTMLAFIIGIKISISEKTNKSKFIQFPKLRKTEPVIYERNKADPEEEKANYFYQ